HPHHHLLRAAQLAARHGRRQRARRAPVPASHRAADGGAVAHPARRHHARGALGRARHPEPGVRAGPARQGAGGAAGVHARGQERRPADPHRARAAVRLPARRLRAGGGGVFVAGHRLPPEPRHLPARHSGAPGRDPRARHVLRAAEPRGGPAADARRSADRPPLMAITTTLPRELDAVAGAPMSYWRTVGWRLARDPATLAAGAVLVLIALSALLAPWLAPYDPNAGSIRLRLAFVGAPAHLLGTDEQGRDMLSRLLWGGRMTLVAGLTPVLVAFELDTGLGVPPTLVARPVVLVPPRRPVLPRARRHPAGGRVGPDAERAAPVDLRERGGPRPARGGDLRDVHGVQPALRRPARRHGDPRVSPGNGAPPLLEVRGLRKHFPLRGGVLQRTHAWVRAVDGVSFDVYPT